ERNKRDLDAQDKEGATPLHHSCLHGHREICKLLLQYGAKTDLKDHVGGTALISATYNKHEGCVAEILDSKRADVNIKDYEGATALHKAAFMGAVNIIDLLLQA